MSLIDATSLKRLNQLHPKVRQSAIDAMEEACQKTPKGIHPFITQTLRSFEESDSLYAQGRTKPGPIVTNAPGGSSLHNYGLALDFVILKDGKMNWTVDKNWMIVVECFKKRGWKWGADWDNDGKTKAQGDRDEGLVDAPHFEKTFAMSWRQLLVRYKAKNFIPGTKFVNI